jgi:hypothetical protein
MIQVRVAFRGIFGLSALLAGGGAMASPPTSPQPIVLLHSFNAASEGSYPVPGLTLDGSNALWGVLTVPPGGSPSTSAPGVLFTVSGLDTATGTGTTGIAKVAIPPLAGSATYYALSFDPNDGSGNGLLFGTSYGDPTLVAGRPQDGAIFQFDPHLGTSGGVLLTSGFTVIQDFNSGGLAGFNESLGGIGFVRPNGTTTYLVGSANNADRIGIYSFPYSTSPSAGSFITSSVGTGFNMSPPVDDPISSAWADFPGFLGLSSTTGDTFGIQGCGGGGCPGNTDFYSNARTGSQAAFGTSYPGGAAEAHSIGIVALANITAQNPISSDYLWIAGNALVWAQADTFNNSGGVPPMTSSGNVVIAHVFSTSLPGGPGDDGSFPMGGLVADPNYLSGGFPVNNAIYYGTTEFGGANGTGTVYCVIPATTGTLTYEKLASFGAAASGAPTHPRGELVAVADGSGGTWLYGSSVDGGANNAGSVFELKAGACNGSVMAAALSSGAQLPQLSLEAQRALNNQLLYVGASKMFKGSGFPVTGYGP